MAWIRWRPSTTGPRAEVQWRDPATGRVRSRTLGVVGADAAELERRHVESTAEGRPPAVDRSTAEHAIAAFCDHLRAGHRAPGTIGFYEYVLGRIAGAIGRPLHLWRRRDIEGVLAGTGAAWSPRTVQMHLQACRTWIAWGRRAGVEIPDFVGDLRGPPVRFREPTHLTPEQVAALLREAQGHPYEAAVALAVLAGLGLADLRSVRWGAEVDVLRERVGGARRKTAVPYRIPMVDPLLGILRRLRGPDGALVCRLPRGDTAATKPLRRMLARAGCPVGGWRLLRHTFATMLEQSGAPLTAIRVALGHRPGSVMTLRYVHPEDAALARHVADVGRRVTGPAAVD